MSVCRMDDSPWCSPGTCAACDRAYEPPDKQMPILSVAVARASWANAILAMRHQPGRTAELRQIIVDAMDVCEQSDDELRLIAALDAFDGWKP